MATSNLVQATQNWLHQRQITGGGRLAGANQNPARSVPFVGADNENPLIPSLQQTDLSAAIEALREIKAIFDQLQGGQLIPRNWAADPIRGLSEPDLAE